MSKEKIIYGKKTYKKNKYVKDVVTELTHLVESVILEMYELEAVDEEHLRGRLSRYVSARDVKGLNDVFIKFANKQKCIIINERYQKLGQDKRDELFTNLSQGFADGVI